MKNTKNVIKRINIDMSNPNKEVIKYRGQCTAEYYNQFFNPNLCHVCKSVDKGNLILCDQCCLISYCSEEHKIIHHPYHEKICAIIAQIVQVKPQQDTCKFSDWQQWVQSRKLLMELVQNELDDKMEPYVQHMILWPKSCYICHQQVKLQVCQRCFSANYCDEHANVFRKTHNGVKCDRLVLLLNIDIETISDNTKNISYKFLQFVNETSCFIEMLEFCMEYILIRRRRDIDWLAKDYVRSDYLSGPLTVYSGFKRAQLFHILKQEYVVIHIIASNSIKRDNLPAWEILLHLIPEIRKLHIIMVGSELTDYFGQHSLYRI
ncbi:uncharacterized protein LOC116846790 [Odontomachus brunneus]|uniref:uncharacterized protein LOC116846790 n=1 Tax=Odontomachus brunneus TaxID=486640 RepID=UPI0013F27774|nr:uncharacterized protein LOC116846790 [Odontomachus brunneus]